MAVCVTVRPPRRPALAWQADIVVTSIGQAELVKPSWLKPGCTVVDVGFNAVPSEDDPGTFRLCGDVDMAGGDTLERVAHITPVPGGVGPMTVAMLLRNTLHSAEVLTARATADSDAAAASRAAPGRPATPVPLRCQC